MVNKQELNRSLSLLNLDVTCQKNDILTFAEQNKNTTQEQKNAINYLLEYYSYIKYINVLSDDNFEERYYKSTEKYKREISKHYINHVPIREMAFLTPFILIILATIAILLPIITSIDYRLKTEFESNAWICTQYECILEEENKLYEYNFTTDYIKYTYNYEDEFDTVVSVTASINLLNGQATMSAFRYYDNIRYYYSLYGNVITSSFTCHTADPDLTLCVDGHIKTAYARVNLILTKSNITIAEIEEDRE